MPRQQRQSTFELGRRPAATRGVVTIAPSLGDLENKEQGEVETGRPIKNNDPLRKWSDVRSSLFWLPDEAKVETEQEEDEMDDGATADLRCFDETFPKRGADTSARWK
jgi:hypothetical protein